MEFYEFLCGFFDGHRSKSTTCDFGILIVCAHQWHLSRLRLILVRLFTKSVYNFQVRSVRLAGFITSLYKTLKNPDKSIPFSVQVPFYIVRDL